MKKIRVYELAKNKNLSNHEVIEMLKKKGFKKVSAITYVEPDVLDTRAQPGGMKNAGAKVSHLFGQPGSANLAAARTAPPVPVVTGKKEATERRVESEKGKTKEAATGKKKPPVEPRKKGTNVLSILAAAFSLVVLVVAGYLYNDLNSNLARVERLTADIQTSMDRIDKTVTANRGQLLDIQMEVTSANRQIDRLAETAFTSQLKSQSAVLALLSTQLGKPLRAKTKTLADNLAAF
jgi:hypothetical protein